MKGEKMDLNVSLNDSLRMSRPRFANKAVVNLKKVIQKHTRMKPEAIKISGEVNRWIWARGKQQKPKKMHLTLKKAEDSVYVFLKEGTDLAAFEKAKKEDKKGKKEEKPKAEEKKEEKTEAEKAEEKKKLEEKKIKEKAAEQR